LNRDLEQGRVPENMLQHYQGGHATGKSRDQVELVGLRRLIAAPLE
jgi:hypothetical protein